jgi:hypothetical protein
MIPLYGFVEDDTLGLLVLAEEDETVKALAEKLQASADVRVAPRAKVEIVHAGRTLDPRTTLRAAGVTALDRVDLRVKR